MNCKRYDIFRGRELNGHLTGLRLAGFAFQNENENFYRVRLMFFPDNIYYISKNQGADYTIFSKMVVQEDEKVIFQNPVGFARIMETIRTHIYVRFPDLSSHMFMSLYPKNAEAV